MSIPWFRNRNDARARDPAYADPVGPSLRDTMARAYDAHVAKQQGQFARPAQNGNALGRYQMTTQALKDAGLLDPNGNWTGKYGVHSRDEFLNSPAAQEYAFDDYMRRTEGYNREQGNFGFVDTTIHGHLGDFTVTDAGLMAAAHRMGAGDVHLYLKRVAENGGISPDFGNLGKSDRDRMLAIETRLREFGNQRYRRGQ